MKYPQVENVYIHPMKSLLFLFLFLVQIELIGQTSLPTFTSGKNDACTFTQYFQKKTDFIIAYSEESYWWSNTENFKLLAQAGSIWTIWTYNRKWKSSSDVYNNKGIKKKKYYKKIAEIDSLSVKYLFDSLTAINFWTLNLDSLNEKRGRSISDQINCKFQIENSAGRKILESYAPEYYISQFPDMRQRIIFLQGKDIFKRWWSIQASNKHSPITGVDR
jgi:hypothetical protein